MARRRRAEKRRRALDPRYGSALVTRMINCLMHSGKRSVAERTLYGAFAIIEQKMKDKPPLEVITSGSQPSPALARRSDRLSR